MADRTMTDIALDDMDAVEAALAVLRNNGINIDSPRNGDLYDIEQERFNAVVDACRTYAARRSSPSQVAPANPAQVTDKRAAWIAEANALVEEANDFAERMTSQPWACELIEKLLDTLTAAIGAGGQAVAVKPLGWEEGNPFIWRSADLYRIEDNGTNWKEDRYWLFIVGERSKHPTLEAAKAAAQADYERRILSALPQPHPADERVVEALRQDVSKLLQMIDNVQSRPRMESKNGIYHPDSPMAAQVEKIRSSLAKEGR